MSSEATPEGSGGARNDDAVFTVSVAAQLVGMHAQTLRQYDRLGIVSPSRTKGRGRRYSSEDIGALREVQRLTKEDGVNLAGVQLALKLREEVAELKERVRSLTEALEDSVTPTLRVFAADSAGQVKLRPLNAAAQAAQTASDSPARHKPSSPNLKALARTDAAPTPGSLSVLKTQRHKSGHALVGMDEVRGWQQLALLYMRRRYRDRSTKTSTEE